MNAKRPNSTPQNYTQWGLPEGAKTRLGKGKVNDIRFSPNGTRLACLMLHRRLDL